MVSSGRGYDEGSGQPSSPMFTLAASHSYQLFCWQVVIPLAEGALWGVAAAALIPAALKLWSARPFGKGRSAYAPALTKTSTQGTAGEGIFCRLQSRWRSLWIKE